MANSVSIDRSAWLWSWNTGRISALEVGLLAWFLFCVHLTARFNYLLFHCTAELFSIFGAGTIFLITINIWRLITNQYFLFIGIAYGFVAGYVLSLGLLKRNRRYFESPVYRLLRMSLLAMIAMELCFTSLPHRRLLATCTWGYPSRQTFPRMVRRCS